MSAAPGQGPCPAGDPPRTGRRRSLLTVKTQPASHQTGCRSSVGAHSAVVVVAATGASSGCSGEASGSWTQYGLALRGS